MAGEGTVPVIIFIIDLIIYGWNCFNGQERLIITLPYNEIKQFSPSEPRASGRS